MKKHARFLTGFLVLWSVSVLAFDGWMARNLYQQWLSRSFVATTGRVLQSQLSVRSGSESLFYRAHVRYEYHVGEKRYESDRVRFGEVSDTRGGAARETVRANPSGLSRPVYYDPAAPAQAVLERGFSRQQLLMAVFVTPFNAMMGFLFQLVWSLRQPIPPAGGAVIHTVAGQLHVKYHRFWGSAYGLLALSIVCMGGSLVLGFSWETAPPAWASVSVWAFGITLAAVVATRRGGTAGLIVDPRLGVVKVRPGPLGSPGSSPDEKRPGRPWLEIPFGRVTGVEVRERVAKGSDGDGYTYVPVLLVRGAEGQAPAEHELGSWLIEEHARSFAEWVRETLRLTATPVA